MRARHRPLLAVLLALAVLAGACGGSSSDNSGGGTGRGAAPDPATVRDGGSATVVQPADATTLDPALQLNSSSQGSSVLSAIYDALFTIDPETNEFEPRIATSFTTEDGLTWTMELREGVTFSDGTPFDAEAVKVNWERAAANPRAAAWSYFQDVESMTAVDATTFQVVLKDPNYEFRWMPTWSALVMIASPAAIEAEGDSYGTATAVGAGPFTLQSRAQGSETVLVRNETYWQDGLPKLDSLTFRTIVDPQQAYDTLTTGAAQASLGVVDQYAAMAEDAGYHMDGTEQVGGTGWLMNLNRAPFDDIRARQALYFAADQQQLVDVAADGKGDLVTSFLPESSPYYDESQALPAHDPEEGQRLLDELAAEGKPLSFTIATAGGDSHNLAVAMQTQLLGFDNIEVQVEQRDPSAYGIGLYQGDFDVAIFGVGGGHPEPVIGSFRTTHSIPISSMDSAEIDALINESRAAADETTRGEIYDRLVKAVNEQYRIIWKTRLYAWNVMAPDTAGIDTYGLGSPLFDSFGYVD